MHLQRSRNEPFEFGCTQLLIPPDVVKELIKKDLVNVSPAGIVFAKPEVRMGILPQMLSEILNTRIMARELVYYSAKYDANSVLLPATGQAIDEGISGR